MKKRILFLLLAVAMVVAVLSMMAFTAFAEDTHSHPICGTDCDGVHGAETDSGDTHEPVEWTPLSSVLIYDSPLAAGNYYLTEDMMIGTIEISGEVNLCLNGYVLQHVNSNSAIEVYGVTLNLCDCNGSGGSHSFTVDDSTGLWSLDESYGSKTVTGGVITGAGDTCVTGGTFNMYGGSIVGNAGSGVSVGTFNMYGGGIVGNAESGRGAGVHLWGSSFNMYGGTISDNASITDDGGQGGGVFVFMNSSFTMYGGSIKNNTATTTDDIGLSLGGGVVLWSNTATFIMNGGTIEGNTADEGGGVYICYNGSFEMNNGTISDNAAKSGGGVFIDKGSFTMNGGSIVDNTTTVIIGGNGGGVCVYSGSFTMKDGTISDNTALFNGGGVFVTTDQSFEMTGGTISGNTATYNGGGVCVLGTFNISGSPKISGNTKSDKTTVSNVYIKADNYLTVADTLEGESRVGVTLGTEDGTGTFAKPSGELTNLTNYRGFFFSDDEERRIGTVAEGANTNLELFAGYTVTVEPVRGGSVTASERYAYEDDPVTLTVTLDTGYELEDISVTCDDNTTPAPTLTLNDNGDYTFTMPASDVTVTATLLKPHIHPICGTDCDGEHGAETDTGDTHEPVEWTPLSEVLKHNENADTWSGVLDKAGSYYLDRDMAVTTIITISGEVDLCLNGYVIQYTGSSSNDGVLQISAGGTLNLCDCNSDNQSHNFAVDDTGLWFLDDTGTETVTGGVIIGGKNIGVYVEGAFNMYGGNIVGSYSFSGISVETDAVFTMNDGTISGNVGFIGGGGVDVSGTFTMNGGTIHDNTMMTLQSGYGSGVYVDTDGTFTMNGGTIRDNSLTHTGGGSGVCVDGGGTFTLDGGTICDNTTNATGGGVYVDMGGCFVMTSGAIRDNTARNGGGVVVREYGGTFTMNGGTISGNAAAGPGAGGQGGGVVVSGTFTMNSGDIVNNSAFGTGGGVNVSGGTFTMNGGTISGNTAHSGGGVDAGGFFTMNKGTISNNTASNNGGGVYVFGGGFEMNDGAISNNTATDYDGGGVYYNIGTFNMSGSPEILGNTRSDGTTADNVYINGSRYLTVVDALEGESLVGVTLSTTVGTFAKPSGNPLTDLTDYTEFFSSDEKLGIRTVEEEVDEDLTYINLELFIGYDITVNTAEHGEIEASATYAAEGDTISISVDPDTNYELESLTVTDENDNEVEYTPDETEMGKYTFTMPASDVWITASFKLMEYTVTYDLNDGNGADGVNYDPETVEAGTEITVKAAPEQDGHTFTGWFDGTTTHQPGWKITVTGNIKLTAQWDEVPKYTVHYDLDGGTGVEGMTYPDETVETGTEVTVKPAPGKDNYTFTGWSDGTTIHQPGGKITVNSNITLTAQWEKDDTPIDPDPPIDVSDGSVKLVKVDAETGEGLAGAVFELHFTSRKDSYVDTYTTDRNGEIEVDDLYPGDYYFLEITAPDGYKKLADKVEFTISEGRSTRLTVENEQLADTPSTLNGIDHWAYIIGYPDGNVRPQGNITRAEVATIFFRLLTDEVREHYMTAENAFSDVNPGQWFNNAISTLSSMGIVNGYPDGTFKPNGYITRAEFAAIAARFEEHGDTTEADFSDVYGDHWAADEIAIAYNNGWIQGYPDGTFKPNQLITRAEAMTVVNRVLNRIPKTPEDLLDDMIRWPDNMNEDAWYYLAVQEATNSHEYEHYGERYERWTDLRPVRDWTLLEY